MAPAIEMQRGNTETMIATIPQTHAHEARGQNNNPVPKSVTPTMASASPMKLIFTLFGQ